MRPEFLADALREDVLQIFQSDAPQTRVSPLQGTLGNLKSIVIENQTQHREDVIKTALYPRPVGIGQP